MAEKQVRYKRSYSRIIIMGMIFFAFAVTAFAYRYSHGIPVAAKQATTNNINDDKKTIMVMGVDSRKDDIGRSDTLMLFVADKKNNNLSVLSVPRDTRVSIKDHKYDKINHAYAYGGHELTQNTIEKLTGVPVNYYILINIDSFRKIIDAIGGVDINVEKRMYYNDPWDDNGGLHIDLYPGMQHLDGKKAIEYVRYRDSEGDIGRITRQQHFISAVLDKLISPYVLPKLPALIKELSGCIETNMSITDMLTYAKMVPEIKNKKITASMLPGTPIYINDISYWLPDIKKLRLQIDTLLGLEETSARQADTEKLVDEYKKSLPAGIKYLDTKDETVYESNKSEQNKQDEKTSEKIKPVKPEDVTVMIINSSGINGAGAKTADILKRRGFKISTVETGGTSAKQHTQIMANDASVSLFYGMPFKCTIMTGSSTNQAVVNIGRDYE